MGGLVNEVGGLLGGSPNGQGFTAQGTNVLQPATLDQANQLYGQAQSGLTQQQQLINALQAQNGIQNQSNVFNQLQGVANGTGPNPALAQLNQSTGQNIANQAALMAGQRGAGANVGLIARQAGLQGGNLQQQAAGQGATLQAQQQLAAMNQLGGIAGQQVANQQNALTGLNQFAQGEQGQVLGAIQGQNNSNVGMQGNINNANAGVAQNNATHSAGAIGGLLNAAGPALGAVFGGPAGAAAGKAFTDSAGGFHSNTYNDGGIVEKENPKLAQVPEKDRFTLAMPSHMNAVAEIYHPHMCGGGMYAHGGKVNAMVSPGEVYLPPEKVKEVKKDGKNPIAEGKKIPGKAEVKGDSLKNDTVPAKLESGGVVIPRSIMQSDDPAGNAAKFIQALHDKNGSSKESPEEFKAALKRSIASRKGK